MPGSSTSDSLRGSLGLRVALRAAHHLVRLVIELGVRHPAHWNRGFARFGTARRAAGYVSAWHSLHVFRHSSSSCPHRCSTHLRGIARRRLRRTGRKDCRASTMRSRRMRARCRSVKLGMHKIETICGSLCGTGSLKRRSNAACGRRRSAFHSRPAAWWHSTPSCGSRRTSTASAVRTTQIFFRCTCG